jgi:DNA gyrase/topoisomerase IV subunit A
MVSKSSMHILSPSQYLRDTSREFAIYVAENRAIPKIHDGLKHGQRMALWVLRNRAEKIKTFALSGLLAYQKIYVHGETSCNNAIGFLAAPYKNNVPLIEGLGQFGGRVAPDAIGAPRYTEVRRAKAAEALLYNDLDIIPTEDNYDGSTRQPQHFLPLIPLVLLNGVSGVAVAWSTNILPHDLRELITATKQAIKGEASKPLVPSYKRYALDVQNLGPSQWELSGQATIVNASTVHVTELPPGLNIEAFRKKLIAMENAEEIVSFTDRSTETIDITIKMKRGSTAHWDSKKAIDVFKLRERITERIVVIGWNGKSIATYESPEALIMDYVAWRLRWFTTRFEKLRSDSLYELTYWTALQVLFEAKFPKKLGTFKDRAMMQEDIINVLQKRKIALDTAQMERVVSLPTYRWTVEFALEIDQKITALRVAIETYEAILGSPDRLRQVYLDELDALLALKF